MIQPLVKVCLIFFRLSYHDREQNSRQAELLDYPERGEAQKLEDGEQMNPFKRDTSQVRHVWLMLGWHEKQVDPVPELEPIQGGHSHEQEDTKQHRHGDENQHRGKENGDSNKEEHQDVGNTLLTEI